LLFFFKRGKGIGDKNRRSFEKEMRGGREKGVLVCVVET